MTEIYMLQDRSKDRQDTWQFLNRRIEDGVHVQEVLNASEGTTKNVAHAVGSAFQTVSTIVWLSFKGYRRQLTLIITLQFCVLGSKYLGDQFQQQEMN